MGPVDLKEIEELELDTPVNLPQIRDAPAVPTSQGRGGRFSSDRKKIEKKYYEPPLNAKKTRRHFRYKVRGGDLFVKVILTGKDCKIQSSLACPFVTFPFRACLQFKSCIGRGSSCVSIYLIILTLSL